MPSTPDLSFTGLDEFVNEPVVENSKAMSSEEEPKVVRKNNDAPIIEEWVLDSEEENVSQTKTEKKIVKPSIAKVEFVKPKQQEKTAKKTVKEVEKHRQNTHSPRGNQRNWNNMMSQKLGSNFEMFNKACYVCGSFDHLQVDCNYHQKQFQNQRMVKPVWNNAQRVNHQNFAKKTHPCAKKNMVPRAVLMKSGLVSINTARQNISKTAVSVNTARQVNTAHSKTTVNAARPMSYLSKTAHSTVKRPIHKNTTFKNSNINQRVNTVRGKKINTARPKAVVNACCASERLSSLPGSNRVLCISGAVSYTMRGPGPSMRPDRWALPVEGAYNGSIRVQRPSWEENGKGAYNTALGGGGGGRRSRFSKTTCATCWLVHSWCYVEEECYLVDPASSHMLVSKIKPCMFKKLVVGLWVGSAGPPYGVHRFTRPFCRRCAPGLNWLGRASGAVTLKKLECSKQAYALRTTAKAFAKDVFINQERKLGARRRSDTVLVSTINDADQGSADVAYRTPLAPYEKSKFLGSGGSMVARLKLKGIDGRAPPGVEPAA
ncbi:hypothetical protein Tco_0367391 [Tanacetum coccineum]